ncbi:MAG: carbon monoxide dehydrogenase [Sulfobacillus acidophilus]|uniref:Carbon monoxide dehydrogenase n=1 Tax=Sulfobacillus acidophilus TaxID=53633 RepID=A0A2T2WP82_9FIRM|nr:MAG: carbon monoxide dehydrogenase [Sulfobacillus acidophilus]
MKPAAFEYIQAASVEEAIQALADHPQAKILAGGQSLVPLMNFRLNRPGMLVDVNNIDDLATIAVKDAGLAIGSLVRHQRLVEDALIGDRLPILAQAASHIGHWAIRNRGTIGGSLAHADPAAELVALMIALNGTLVVRSHRGVRRLTADEFFLGYFTTALEPTEIIVQCEIPAPTGRMGFSEVVRRPGDFALAGAIVAQSGAAGWVTWFGLGSRPERFSVSHWGQDDGERHAMLGELATRMMLAEDEEYKRDIAVNAAMRAYRQIKEGK